MKLHTQLEQDNDGHGITQKWLEIEDSKEVLAIKFLREAIIEQLEARMVAELDLAIECVYQVFDKEGFGAFKGYEDLE